MVRWTVVILFGFGISASTEGQELDFLVSPGPLNHVHSELSGLTNCVLCHSPGKGVEEDKCLACHKDLAARIQAKTGFHREKESDCFACHPEHQGEAFELAPVDPSALDHNETGYPLVGMHLVVEGCGQCHTSANSPPREKTRTYFLNDTRCVACHTDEHRGQLGEECQKCHGLDESFDHVRFNHDRTVFALRGAHARVDCKQCHINQQWKGLQFSNCSDCHKEPHQPSSGADCERCHGSTSWKVGGFNHDKTRYPLRGMHRDLSCNLCHKAQRFRGVAFERCEDCHRKDPHLGQFKQDCSRCHRVEGFKQTLFDHGESRYPLKGKHVSITCSKCHAPEEGDFPAGLATAVRYKPLQTFCAACHEDVHFGQFEKSCEDCHTTTGFDSQFLLFQHNRDSRYRLLGKHASVACQQCHKYQDGSFPSGDGGSIRYRPLSDRCVGCHLDVHAPTRRASHCPSTSAECQRCHSFSTFDLTAFDHSSTSLPLTGKHESLSCDGCHQLVPFHDRSILSFGRTQSGCVDCHRSPHSSKWDRCMDCHTTKDWRVSPW